MRQGKIPAGYYDTLLCATKSDARGVALSRVPLETAGEADRRRGGGRVVCASGYDYMGRRFKHCSVVHLSDVACCSYASGRVSE